MIDEVNTNELVLVETARVLLEMIVLVAVTPFTFTVRMLPEIEAEKKLIMLATVEVIPLIMVVKKLPVEVAMLDVTRSTVVVATIPLTLEDSTKLLDVVERESRLVVVAVLVPLI